MEHTYEARIRIEIAPQDPKDIYPIKEADAYAAFFEAWRLSELQGGEGSATVGDDRVSVRIAKSSTGMARGAVGREAAFIQEMTLAVRWEGPDREAPPA